MAIFLYCISIYLKNFFSLPCSRFVDVCINIWHLSAREVKLSSWVQILLNLLRSVHDNDVGKGMNPSPKLWIKKHVRLYCLALGSSSLGEFKLWILNQLKRNMLHQAILSWTQTIQLLLQYIRCLIAPQCITGLTTIQFKAPSLLFRDLINFFITFLFFLNRLSKKR